MKRELDPSLALSVERLGKCFYLPAPERGKKARGVIETIRSWPPRIMRGMAHPFSGRREFWALRDVSFDVKQGTILGVIGANGAGKSTLLKILARITPPTGGSVRGRGRVVSLLELGAGFNPDVSARENVIMNAAMYGVSKRDVERNFDQIIAFAEVEQFVETPLRFYSSGMYLRLAFSVAVNMHPRILLADEILAVGDLAFQERCLARVRELASEGLTVLFVSHDMEAVLRVCNDVLWLNNGRIEQLGDPEDVVAQYQHAAWANVAAARTERGRHTNRYADLIGAKLVAATGKEIGAAPIGEDVFIRLRFTVTRAPVRIRSGFDLTHRGGLIFRSMADVGVEITELGAYEAFGKIPAFTLTEITYGIDAFILTEAERKEGSLIVYNAVSFMGYDAERPVERQQLQKGALLAPKLEWTVSKESELVGT